MIEIRPLRLQRADNCAVQPLQRSRSTYINLTEKPQADWSGTMKEHTYIHTRSFDDMMVRCHCPVASELPRQRHTRSAKCLSFTARASDRLSSSVFGRTFTLALGLGRRFDRRQRGRAPQVLGDRAVCVASTVEPGRTCAAKY